MTVFYDDIYDVTSVCLSTYIQIALSFFEHIALTHSFSFSQGHGTENRLMV